MNLKYAILLPFLLFPLLLLANASQAQQRVASLNFCTDQLLLQLADRQQIATISYLAADPERSTVAHLSEGLHLNHGRAEEILSREPDLIVNSRYSAGAAVKLLERLGQQVITFDFAITLDEGISQIRRMAALLEQQARGEQLIQRMQARIAAHLPALQETHYRTLFLASNGMSFGSSTLRDFFIDSLGWENLAASLGLQGAGMLNLEEIIAAEPDFLLISQAHGTEQALAHHLLQHPALAQFAREGRYFILPDALFECAGPPLAVAYARLDAQLTPLIQLQELPKGRQP